MIGRAQLACDIDERWNGPPPRCERKNLVIIYSSLICLSFYSASIAFWPPFSYGLHTLEVDTKKAEILTFSSV